MAGDTEICTGPIRHLLKDGHGSARQLVHATGAVIDSGTAQVFAYDAYGIPVGFTLANALTALVYSGELTDQLTGLQYLRARYYNPATGTFNRLDPFAGNFSDPQSLHKYLYCHADAVNGWDPTGESLVAFVSTIAIGAVVGGTISYAMGGSFIEGAVWGGIGGAVGYFVFPVFAGLFGASSSLFGFYLTLASTGFTVGSTIGGLQSWWHGGDYVDIMFDALETGILGAAVSLAFGPFIAPKTIPRQGAVHDANFAQSGINRAETFSREGREFFSRLAGRVIETVDDLVQAIDDGVVAPKDIPVDYIVKDGTKLILNTVSFRQACDF